MRRARLAIAAATVATIYAAPAWAINGNELSLNSGATSGSTAVLNNNGYAGAYITLAEPGNVTVNVSATGTAFGGVNPHLNIVVADTKVGFEVNTAGFNNYSHTFNLPAGTYFVRNEFTNDAATTRSMTIGSMSVNDATIVNSTDTTVLSNLALDAANTYIQNYRKGPGKVTLVGVPAGTSVDVQLKRHAFNFGANFRGTTATANPGSNQQDVNFYLNNPNYVSFFKKHFNMLVPSNGGKWANNEALTPSNLRDVQDLSAINAMMNFAEADGNGIRVRMHNLIWATQQPAFVTDMLTNPTQTDASPPTGTGQTKLLGLYGAVNGQGQPISEISERIGYLVGDGDADANDGDLARRYTELDVYNESWHTGVNTPGSSANYWDRYGANGISNIYRDVSQAINAAGSTAKVYVNEYDVHQNGPDQYANWYRDHIEAVQNADGNPGNGPIQGIGTQYYALPGASAKRMQQSLQNLSVEGLPITLTEFGVQDDVTDPAEAKKMLEDAMTMMFGTPQATGFLIWGWGSGSHTGTLQSSSVLVDSSNWTTLTDAGKAYEDLLGIANWDSDPNDGWTTHVTLPVAADGTIDFTGFYGDYEVKIGPHTYSLTLTKGDPKASLVVAPGDYNADGQVDAGDYTIWRDSLGSATDLRADGNGNEVIDQGDYVVWQAFFGTTYTIGAGNSVPEPASIVLVLMGAVAACGRHRVLRQARPAVAAF